MLANCYRNSLRLASEAGAQSVAFPAISTGVYGYPLTDAAQIAVETVRDVQRTNAFAVTFVCFDAQTQAVYEDLLAG